MMKFGMRLSEAKAAFFDRKAVIGAMSKRSHKALSRFGGFVRKVARHSIKKSKKASLPTFPPRSHIGLLRNYIFYSYDKRSQSVVIGPVKLNRTVAAKFMIGLTTVPEVLEYGGTTIITVGANRGQRKKVKPRPYMEPAFDKGLKKLPEFWQETIK